MLKKISEKIAFSFLGLVFISLGFLYFSSLHLSEIRKLSLKTIQQDLSHKTYINDLEINYIELFSLIKSSLSLLDLEMARNNHKQIEKVHQSIQQKIEQKPEIYSEIIARLQYQISGLHKQLYYKEAEMYHFVSSFSQMQAYDVYDNEIAIIRKEIIKRLHSAKKDLLKETKETERQVKITAQNSFIALAALSALVIIISTSLGLFLWFNTIMPLQEITELLTDTELHPDKIIFLNRKDEIGDLARTFHTLLDSKTNYETELNKQKLMLGNIIDNMPVAVAVKDANKRFTYIQFNKKAEELSGFEKKDVLGQNDYDVFPKEFADKALQSDDYARKTGDIVDLERQCYSFPNGNKFIGRTRKVLVSDNTGQENLLLVVTEDITEQVNAQDQINAYAQEMEKQTAILTRARIEAEKANAAKTDFLANMSHELRTPLNSVIGLTQLISQEKMNVHIREMFDTIQASAKSLLGIVNDILDLSKIEAREVILENIPFDLYKQIIQLIRSQEPLAQKKGINLNLHSDTDSFYVFGDPLRFSKILNNLISNAIRYTDQGSVLVETSIWKKDDDTGDQILRLSVKDTGIGIPENRLESVFEKFSQADTSTTRKYGGTGLGLTITKELVELMGGEIGVKSKLGEGSTFWIEIPFKTAQEQDLAQGDKHSKIITHIEGIEQICVTTTNVLIAEDNLVNVNFMKKLMKNLHFHSYDIADSGEQALKLLNEKDYDLILMDCHMPIMSGYDATTAIRELDDENKRDIPIIAMTANAMPEDREKCLSIGMNAYISKPVDIEIFKLTLSPWVDFESHKKKKPAVKKEPQKDESSTEALYDLTTLEANAMGDTDFMNEMIGLFVTQGRKQLGELKIYCVDGESEDWTEIAHTLKGTAGSVGAEDFRQFCAQAQVMIDSSANKREETYKKLETLYNHIVDQLIEDGHYKA